MDDHKSLEPTDGGKCPWCPAHYSTSVELSRHLESKWNHLPERLAAVEAQLATNAALGGKAAAEYAELRQAMLDGINAERAKTAAEKDRADHFEFMEAQASKQRDAEKARADALLDALDTTNWGDHPLPEDADINKAFPTRTGRHDIYREARRLVGAKRSKGALVSLVNWLLARTEAAEVRAAAAGNLAVEWTVQCEYLSTLVHIDTGRLEARATAAEARAEAERAKGAKLAEALRLYAADRCDVAHASYPNGTTCEGVIAHAVANPEKYSDEYRTTLIAGSRRCGRCHARVVLAETGETGT